MPKIDSVFSQFRELDKLSSADINSWLKVKEQPYILENYIGNKMIYPQTVPVDSHSMEIDLAILREYIKTHLDNFYIQSENKVIIPELFVGQFPPLLKLVKTFLDVIRTIQSTTELLLVREKTQLYLGMIIHSPHEKDFICKINNQQVKIRGDSIAVVSTQKREVKLELENTEEITIPAGEIGIIFDTRKQG